MRDFVIYEDENKKIEIDGEFHWLLKQIRVKDFKLPPEEFNYVIKIGLNKLRDLGIQLSNATIIGNIPIIQSNWPIALRPPHDEFNGILAAISEYDCLDDNTELIIEELEEEFETDGYNVVIFPHRIYDVKGMITRQTEDKDYLMFFGFEE